MNKNFLMIAMVLISVGIVGGALLFAGTLTGIGEHDQLKKFNSYEELTDFLKTNQEKLSYSGGFGFGRTVQKVSTFGTPVTATATAESATTTSVGTQDYSATNIQVEGVDEADIVKNDGKYIYTVVGNKLFIIDAYPAEEARVVSESALKGNPTEIFVNNDRLVVFSNDYSYESGGDAEGVQEKIAATDGVVSIASPMIVRSGNSKALIIVYDISDREKPAVAREVSTTGNYHDSRMIGDYIYAVVNQPVYYYVGGEPVPLPAVAENGNSREVPASDVYYFDYPDSSYSYVNIVSLNIQDNSEDYSSKTFLAGSAQNTYVSLGSIYLTYTKWNNIYTADNVIDEVVIPVVPNNVGVKIRQVRESAAAADEKMRQIGEELNRYASSLSKDENEQLQKGMEQKSAEFERRLAKQQEQTVVHRIAISSGQIDYKSQGTVPGHVLNQFSMDEHKGFFRIATTTTGSSFGRFSTQTDSVQISPPAGVRTNPEELPTPMPEQLPTPIPPNLPMPPPNLQQTKPFSNPPESRPTSQNHVYVLDENLKVVGAVDDLAPGEKIYSARFMGDRAYMVTFKKIDPLFVIDLSEPTAPRVLGKLKIPGYSDYLHPYDENHIIGLGKEAAEAETGDFAWYQGIKLALFDVSDPENPGEVSKYNIGDRGTDSYALQDHKAFLFSRQKNLLVIPVLLAEIDESKYAEGNVPPYAYGDFEWQGAYVLSLDTENGFGLKGKITHLDTEEGNQQLLKSGYYFRSEYDVKRSLYMDDVLYTLSDGMIKMNDLAGLEEVNKIELPK